MPSEFIQRQKDDFFRDLTSFGSLWFYIILMLFFLIQENYQVFKKLIVGFVLIYGITIIIRSIWFKNRPKKYSYNNYIEKLDAASFPSLHATRISFLGLFFASYFNNFMLSFLIVVLVLIVLYARTYLKKHDWKDVIAGFIIGILVYLAVNLI